MLSLTRSLNTVMLVSLPETRVPGVIVFTVVVILQSLPGGVVGLPLGTQFTVQSSTTNSVTITRKAALMSSLPLASAPLLTSSSVTTLSRNSSRASS